MYDDCHLIGMNGGCGYECRVLLSGNCSEGTEAVNEGLRLENPELFIELRNLYGMEDDTKLLDVCGM